MKTEEKLNENIVRAVTTYVYENYKQYKDKKLYISMSENKRCFYISDNKDASPLILGTGLFIS